MKVKDLIRILQLAGAQECDVHLAYDGGDRAELEFMVIGDDNVVRLCSDYLYISDEPYKAASILSMPKVKVELIAGDLRVRDA